MTGLKAALYKDIKLFFRGAGLISLILPFVLLVALYFGMSDTSSSTYVQPFPIAVRNLDTTFMSKSLISELTRVELFSDVIMAEEEKNDADYLESGIAAVITIPEDFFYKLYKMDDCVVDVTLNEDMPFETALFNSVFTSVMDIISADQAAARGVYTFSYGEITDDLYRSMYVETSDYLLKDALSRQTIFDTEEKASDLAGALQRKLLATILSMMALFFSLCAVKTIPEEKNLGVIPRFKAAGGSLFSFVLSKFLAALILSLPTLILTAAIFSQSRTTFFFITAFVMIFAAFGLMIFLASITKNTVSFVRCGNLFILISLVLGGSLWSQTQFPEAVRFLSNFTLPYYGILGLEAYGAGAGIVYVLGLLWPAILMGVLGITAACLFKGITKPHAKAADKNIPDSANLIITPDTENPSADDFDKTPRMSLNSAASVKKTGLLPRITHLAKIKLMGMCGGAIGLIIILAVSLLCGEASAYARAGGAESLSLAICDLDESEMSAELIELISAKEGLFTFTCGQNEGEKALITGKAEGLLIIKRGYGEILENEEIPVLSYKSSSAAVSAEGAREIIAGQAALQKAKVRAVKLAASHTGHELSETEINLLYDCIDEAKENASPLYQIKTVAGASPEDPFSPTWISFLALVILLTLFTAAPWGGSEGIRAERRMKSLSRGKTISFGSDFLGVFLLGILLAAAVAIPAICTGIFSLFSDGAPDFSALSGTGILNMWCLLSVISYTLCVSLLALFLTRFSALEGRVDALAPFITLILCLAGGCFMDLSQFSPVMAKLAMITPPGLASSAASGSAAAVFGLLAECAVFFALDVLLLNRGN